MLPEVVTGLTIVAILVFAVWLFITIVNFLLDLSASLGAWIFHSDGPLLGRLLAIIPWVPLALFRAFVLVIGLLCAISLVGDAKHWLKK